MEPKKVIMTYENYIMHSQHNDIYQTEKLKFIKDKLFSLYRARTIIDDQNGNYVEYWVEVEGQNI